MIEEVGIRRIGKTRMERKKHKKKSSMFRGALKNLDFVNLTWLSQLPKNFAGILRERPWKWHAFSPPVHQQNAKASSVHISIV